MGADADLLKEVPLFESLGDVERADLAEKLDVVTAPAGQVLFHVNEPGDALFIVCTGEVEIFFKNDTGERIVLEVAARGDFFGELSLFDRGPRSASVVVTQDVELLRLRHDHLE